MRERTRVDCFDDSVSIAQAFPRLVVFAGAVYGLPAGPRVALTAPRREPALSGVGLAMLAPALEASFLTPAPFTDTCLLLGGAAAPGARLYAHSLVLALGWARPRDGCMAYGLANVSN